MRIQAVPTSYSSIEAMRAEYRAEANVQIVHDSILQRGLADAYLILVDGKVQGYGGVWNRYSPGRVMEFFTRLEARRLAVPMFREMLLTSMATEIEAQSNMPLMTLMLYDFGQNIVAENVLFVDALPSDLECPGGLFRPTRTGDLIGPGKEMGEWVVEAAGEIVATGGFLTHYNPPYGDIYMEVRESAKRKGYGAFIVQELKRVCREAGKIPTARCNAENLISRKTLEKAGMLPVGRLLVGEVRS